MSNSMSFLSSALALFGMWIAFDRGYRAYRISVLRDGLFALRAELFEGAREGVFGELGFSDPVYQRTRRLLNSSIRFADQVTLSRLFVLLWSSQWWFDRERVSHEAAAFHHALMERSPEARSLVKHIMREVDLALMTHMVYVNALGYVFLTLLGFAARCFRVQQKVRSEIAKHILRNRRMLEPLEQDALNGLERLEHG